MIDISRIESLARAEMPLVQDSMGMMRQIAGPVTDGTIHAIVKHVVEAVNDENVRMQSDLFALRADLERMIRENRCKGMDPL